MDPPFNWEPLQVIPWIDEAVRIYPNPANDIITVENTSLLNKETIISIYNMQGQLMLQKDIQQAKTEINISELHSGMYYIKVKTKKGTIVKKLIKNSK